MLRNKMTKAALLIVSMTALLWAGTATTLGIVSSDDAKAQGDYAPFIKLLKEKGDINVELKTYSTLEELETALKSGEAAFTFVSPTDYVKLNESAKVQAVATKLNKGGTPYCQGTIVAAKDKGIESIKDLKGKSICYGPKGSFNKYLAALAAFKENDLKESDLDAKFGSSCGNIASHILEGKTDAGVICDYSWDGWEAKDAKEYTEKLVVVGKGPKLRDKAVAASPKSDKKTIAALVKGLVALNGAEELIQPPLKAKGFAESTDADYDALREILKSL